jgi:hypothetical protein
MMPPILEYCTSNHHVCTVAWVPDSFGEYYFAVGFDETKYLTWAGYKFARAGAVFDVPPVVSADAYTRTITSTSYVNGSHQRT